MTLTAEQQALLAAWDVGTVLSSAIPATGTINQTLLVTTACGDYALRAYRHRDREPVAREHAVIAHVRARGLPAIAPLPLPDGTTILERAGRYYALFAGRVSAIIDWDQTHIAPRAWEVARTLHLAFGFTPALCGPFWDAYRAEQTLPLAELDRVAAGYILLRVHDLWVYEAYYFEGNERVRAFISPGDFVPLAMQWAGLRAVWPADGTTPRDGQ